MNITKFCIGPLYPMEATPYPKSATFSQMALLLMGLSQGHWEMRRDEEVAKGVVLCTTSAGSGLYVDSILESQGIIVKVRCLGCGGTGNVMCSECGGRGHRGPK
ncbi:dnaJ [Gossypium arboreum]|uniref:DnaJ n=1 Tax=Gossypium arboreum TaxID=29729 RepID=A0A0B0NN45_GOSAR|nr:dnaJ [Gossypium arboreum]